MVFTAPAINDDPGMLKVGEPVLVQTFIVESAIERLNVCVLIRLAGFDEKEAECRRACAQVSIAQLQSFLPLSVRIALGSYSRVGQRSPDFASRFIRAAGPSF
jgi:hypothetical protein